MARRYGVRPIVIKTTCDDPDLIRKRLAHRHANPHAKDREITEFRYFELTAHDVARNPIEADPEFARLSIETIVCDTGHNPHAQASTQQ